jgi:hypothetical protein
MCHALVIRHPPTIHPWMNQSIPHLLAPHPCLVPPYPCPITTLHFIHASFYQQSNKYPLPVLRNSFVTHPRDS